jgi:hypothetical protein
VTRLPGFAFWLWVLVGVGFGLGVSAIGVLTVPPSLIVSALLLTRPPLRESAYGALVGIGAVLLLVAYINLDGPFKAGHWLLAGVAFVATGLAAHFLTTRRKESRA